MTEIVSSFFPVRAANFQYVFLLCNESLYTTWIQEALDENAALFGEDLGIKAKIVQTSGFDPTRTSGDLAACRFGSRCLKNETCLREYVRANIYWALLP